MSARILSLHTMFGIRKEKIRAANIGVIKVYKFHDPEV